ncbi:PKD [Seminavis robusta]|uniref:PKD n=1 Tax=Seminavis robusta TaxID=568900 RepID=A0A9N8DNL2_9STRA|nr:PKD [Seminavis robusta]|eukprot:Sro262_g101960.1 PKD (1286) ;mRNA; f:15893-19901
MVWVPSFALLIFTILHAGAIEGRLHRPSEQQRRRLKGETNAKNSDTNNNNDELADKKTTVLDEEEQFELHDVCRNNVPVTLGETVRGDHHSGIQGICDTEDSQGAWYSINGTGQVLRASVVEGNVTRIVVFAGSDCDHLSCENSITPVLTDNHSQSSNGWTTFWGTKTGVSYFMYLYGSGHFQLILAEERRPDNDQSGNALSIEVGDSIQGSTAYASPDPSVGYCGSSASSQTRKRAAPGLWYRVSGTGAPLQARLRTVSESYRTQASIYTESLECVAHVERLELFDPASPEYYAISTATTWQSLPGQTYFIQVLGHPDSSPGAYEEGGFELTIFQSSPPVNDNCDRASVIRPGNTERGSTSFATIDEDTLVCSQVTLGETPTAPGVWMVLSGVQGPMEAAVESAYSSQLTVFSGDCERLVCLEGTDNAPPDATDLVATNYSSVRWIAQSDEIYHLLVHGVESLVGIFDITVSHAGMSSGGQGASTPETTTPPSRPDDGGSDVTTSPNTAMPTSTLWEVETAASMAFGFFPGTPIRAPNQDEIDGLMVEVSHFFARIFQDAFDDAFIRFEAQEYVTAFSDDSALPIVMNFLAKAYFTSEHVAPSEPQIFNLMEGANFQDFIRSYAWQLEPFGATVFFQTLRVVFDQATQSPPSGGTSDSGGSQAESVQRIDARAKMLFSFFPDTAVREPTHDELDGLVLQTRLFFGDAFDKKFPDFIRFGAIVSGTNFTEDAALPVEVSMDVYVFFELTDINGNPTTVIHTPDEVLSTMRDVEITSFIQSYVWESKPFAENIFYEAMHIQIRPDGVNVSAAESTAVAPHVVHSRNKATFQFALSFSFHHTATVTLRQPVQAEIAGLLVKTDDFFTALLLDELPGPSGFGGLNLTAASVDYTETREFAVVVVVKAEVTYHDGSDVSSRATVEQMLALMETANMKEYVEYYVWFADPQGHSIFFATKQAVLEPDVPLPLNTSAPTTAPLSSGSSAPGNVLSDATPEPAELLPVGTDIAIRFFFFQPPNRAPTNVELDSLTNQTTAFFTKALQATYSDLIRLDLDLITAGYAPSGGAPASIVSWKVSVLFYILDGSGASRTPDHVLNILTTSDVEDYLHNYVWSTQPLGSNLFFNASAAQVVLLGDSSATTDEQPTPAPTARINTSQVVVHASILYGFLEDIAITRTPNTNEQNGIRHQTTLFFTRLFRDQFPESFQRVDTSIDDVELLGGNTLPISVSYVFTVQFNQGEAVPSLDDLVTSMTNADFESYIENYVWTSGRSANGIFFDTQQVLFQAVM